MRKSVKALVAELERKNRERQKAYLAGIALQQELLESLAKSLKHAGVDIELATSGIKNKMRRESEKVSSRRFKVPRSWYD